jgi:FKBP-type peptidyl-prolyl cis-trans isomerase
MRNYFAAVALAALLGACGQPESVVISDEDGASDFSTDEQRILYALGVALGENIGGEFALTEQDLEFVAAGIEDAVLDAPYRIDMELYGPRIQELANTRRSAGVAEEKAAAAEFAAEVAMEPGAEVFPSGLVLVPVTPGDGESPEATDTVRVHYHGTLRDGTVFDSSRDRGEPATFPLNQVIPCWTEGVQQMQVGETARLLCPSDIAYGDNGRPPAIPGGAALLFEVELLEIVE